METLEKAFIPSHLLHGVPVMRNPNALGPSDFKHYWVDESGTVHRSGINHKAERIVKDPDPGFVADRENTSFGVAYAKIGEVIPSDWWMTHYAHARSPKGVMISREAAAAALRACAWPDSSAPCGQAGNSNDDDATFSGKDSAGNCIVRLFIRGKGYFQVKIPAAMFLEVVDE